MRVRKVKGQNSYKKEAEAHSEVNNVSDDASTSKSTGPSGSKKMLQMLSEIEGSNLFCD